MLITDTHPMRDLIRAQVTPHDGVECNLTIRQMVDEALWQTVRSMDCSKLEICIVLNTPSRNAFMSDFEVLPYLKVGEKSQERYRGALLAVTHDETVEAIQVFTRRKS